MPRYFLAASPIVLAALCLNGCTTSQQYAQKGDPRKPAVHSRVAAARNLQGRLANASYAKRPLARQLDGSPVASEPNAAARTAWIDRWRSESGNGGELELIHKLSDPAPANRALAAFDLSRLESPSSRAAAAIAHRLEVERDPRVRTFLNEGLVRLAPERQDECLSEIRLAAQSEDEAVGALAAVILADLKTTP